MLQSHAWLTIGQAALLLAAVANCAQHANFGKAQSEKVPRKLIFMLPDGYRGPFIGIYDQRGAAPPQWRGDTAVYRVDKTGIVGMSLPMPPRSTKTSHVFAGAPNVWIDNYPTCADMRVYVTDDRPRICWLDYQRGATGVPNHIVAVVTDWAGIPAQFNRTSFVYDSALFGGGKAHIFTWKEPKDLPRQRVQKISE